MLHLWYWLKRKTPATYRPIVLITGCSSGVGLAIAELLRKKTNYRVVATARKSSLESLQKKFKEDERFIMRPLDVTNEKEREALIKEIHSLWGGINILVNNAGISYRSVVEHMTEEDEQRQMQANYFGPVGLIRLVLPHMRERGRGKIINISSVSGMLAMPTMASYSASKHALEGMSEALWFEAKPLGINVSLVQPGFINSKSFKNVYFSEKSKPENARTGPYNDYYKNMTPFVERFMKMSRSKPEDIAKLVLKVIRTQNPPLWIPATFDAWVFYYLRRLVPRRIFTMILFWALPRSAMWAHKYTQRRD